jgi:hypothetical protein
LDRAVNEHDRRLCPCGCGHWYSETHGLDEDGEPHDPGEWIVVQDTCAAREAIDSFLADQKERPPGQMLYTRARTDEDD